MTLKTALLVTGLVIIGIAAGLWIGRLLWHPDVVIDRMRREGLIGPERNTGTVLWKPGRKRKEQ